MQNLFEGILCIKHGRISIEKLQKGKETYFSYGNATSPLKILKLKPTDKEQQLDHKKVDVGFVAQQMPKEHWEIGVKGKFFNSKWNVKVFLQKQLLDCLTKHQ